MVDIHEYAFSNGCDHLCVLLGGFMVRREVSSGGRVVDEGFDHVGGIGFNVPIY